MLVKEFRHINDLNDYLSELRNVKPVIIPLSRQFQNPVNNLIVSTITYIVIEE